MSALMLGALGVVFGDIGTSPLYALRECFHSNHHELAISNANLLGVLSLMTWVLLIVITIEYVTYILRADNHGEGGILALMALVTRHSKKDVRSRAIFAFLGLVGAALLFADAMITPAISVLSAMEGLNAKMIGTHFFEPLIVPLALTVLGALYVSQQFGSAKIGVVFGPVMLAWFSVLSVIGITSAVQTPAVFAALNPYYAVHFLLHHQFIAFVVMGSIFLVVTGGEALYADMGHFGRKPIQRVWVFLVLPGLLLNYYGQGATLLRDPSTVSNLFYETVPDWAVLPMVFMATLATVIASQAVISGAFSVANSAVQLGYSPRLEIRNTSAETIGQIYVPAVNWVMMLGTAALVIGFGSSSNLAAAYGLAVSTTMLVTTMLLFFVATRVWRWPTWRALLLVIPFLCIDTTFFTSNLLKIPDGGWLPVLVGIVVYVLMDTWKRGRTLLMSKLAEENLDDQLFLDSIQGEYAPARVSGTAIFLTGSHTGIPRALLHNLKHNKVLHDNVLLLTVDSERVPYVRRDECLEVITLGHGLFRAVLNFGFLERPNIPKVLEDLMRDQIPLDPMDTTYFLGRETILPRKDCRLFSRWRRVLYSVMARNATSAASYFQLPPNRVVEVGYQVEI